MALAREERRRSAEAVRVKTNRLDKDGRETEGRQHAMECGVTEKGKERKI